ncbi:MAG TPA: HD domain-containing phosphohydrolase [Rectinemataceae bacterium]|nr:HD domain-containing phosphohydrolase [Rectinemataceae bacterium]
MENRKVESVLIVDDVPENLRLLATILGRNGLVPRPVTSGKLAIEAALADPPDIVLMDVGMPEMSGLEVCQWFKKDERLKEIPIIFLSGLQEIGDKIEAFRVGGVDYIGKPFQELEVIARIKTHLQIRRLNAELVSHNERLEELVAEQVKQVTASQMAMIFALAKLAEVRDDDTGKHIERVQTYTKALALRMRDMKIHAAILTDSYIDNLFQASSLHDIGKVGTPDAILLKPGKLTPEEYAVMKMHCAIGADALAAVQKRFPDNQFLSMGVEVARSHQEKWDGSGYPDGLKAQKIPLPARIVALADFYDALTSNRCYRPAFDHQQTCRMIQEGSDAHFDPEIIGAFMTIEGQFRQVRHEMGNDEEARTTKRLSGLSL